VQYRKEDEVSAATVMICANEKGGGGEKHPKRGKGGIQQLHKEITKKKEQEEEFLEKRMGTQGFLLGGKKGRDGFEQKRIEARQGGGQH